MEVVQRRAAAAAVLAAVAITITTRTEVVPNPALNLVLDLVPRREVCWVLLLSSSPQLDGTVL